MDEVDTTFFTRSSHDKTRLQLLLQTTKHDAHTNGKARPPSATTCVVIVFFVAACIHKYVWYVCYMSKSNTTHCCCHKKAPGALLPDRCCVDTMSLRTWALALALCLPALIDSVQKQRDARKGRDE